MELNTDSDILLPIVRSSIPQMPDIVTSGGQSGSDFGGLLGAKALGIPTGGFAPKGFRTERGSQPELGSVFGLVESHSANYDVRTSQNLELCNAVILIAYDFESPGTNLTYRLAFDMLKPVFKIPYSPHLPIEPYKLVQDTRWWLDLTDPSVLMIAGNRESKAKGIEKWTSLFIQKLFDKTFEP